MPIEKALGRMARYKIDSARSRLWAEARSSLHPIHVETDGFEGYVELVQAEGRLQLGLPTHVELEANLLKSGNALVDRELKNRLEIRKYPRVVGEVREVKALDDGTRYHLRGDLTLHGVTRSLEADVTLRRIDDGAIELEGEKQIDMRDFGLNPPKLFIFRVYPEVQIKVRVVAALSS
jgi:polyisoprenoid-binding protein YceI